MLGCREDCRRIVPGLDRDLAHPAPGRPSWRDLLLAARHLGGPGAGVLDATPAEPDPHPARCRCRRRHGHAPPQPRRPSCTRGECQLCHRPPVPWPRRRPPTGRGHARPGSRRGLPCHAVQRGRRNERGSGRAVEVPGVPGADHRPRGLSSSHGRLRRTSHHAPLALIGAARRSPPAPRARGRARPARTIRGRGEGPTASPQVKAGTAAHCKSVASAQ